MSATEVAGFIKTVKTKIIYKLEILERYKKVKKILIRGGFKFNTNVTHTLKNIVLVDISHSNHSRNIKFKSCT